MKSGVLLSGGMDSIALTYWKRPDYAVTIDYGQAPAPAEIRAASAVSEALGITHFVVRSPIPDLGSGDLAGSMPLDIAPVREWWPFRNQLLITLAAMKLIQVGVIRLFIGCLVTDRQHADGSKEFVDAMDYLVNLQEGGMRICAPAIGLTAAELIRTSEVSPEILAWAHSCHTSEYACGECRGCRKHYETMAELGGQIY